MSSSALEASARTAIARDGPSAPCRWLWDEGMVVGPVLDFGSGRGADTRWLRSKRLRVDAYDPNWTDDDPELGRRDYQTVICIYVVNVLPRSHQARIMEQIRASLAPGGVGFIVVRSDVERDGWTGADTYQRDARMRLPLLAERSGYRIYYTDNE